jgi:hypothetical protein
MPTFVRLETLVTNRVGGLHLIGSSFQFAQVFSTVLSSFQLKK